MECGLGRWVRRRARLDLRGLACEHRVARDALALARHPALAVVLARDEHLWAGRGLACAWGWR